MPKQRNHYSVDFKAKVALAAIKGQHIVRALEYEGFQFTERQGSQRVYRHADGRRIIIHYHRPNDTLTPYVIRHLLVGTRWTEADLRRLELIK
jgi:predicted RNA binding protein YcfA (HicA-like mRNA interferase family)